MKYQCIRCHTTWGDGVPEVEGYSHGLCLQCLREALVPLYRRRQVQEGHFDCFGRSTGYCDQSECKYHRICVASVAAVSGDGLLTRVAAP